MAKRELEKRQRQRGRLDGAGGGAGEGIVAYESAAFLSGTLAEYWEERGIVVPVWAWTNLLAHGSEALIAETIGRPARGRRTTRGWKSARSSLAVEMFDLVDDEFPLPLLQSTILVPLELALSGRAEVRRWSIEQWVDTVDLAIRDQPIIPDR